jgi:hypothetical protein
MVDLPPGWAVFEGGGSDDALCDSAVPLSLHADANLSCIENIHTVNLTWAGGVPPYTVTATGGLITVVDLTHATLKIDADIPVVGIQCGQVGAFAYAIKGSVSFVNNTGCGLADPWLCNVNYYNCYGQWVGWTMQGGVFAGLCNDASFPVPEGVSRHRFQSCNTACEEPVINPDDLYEPPPLNEPCIANVAQICAYPTLLPNGLVHVQNFCNSILMLDLELPGWNVQGCYPSSTLAGESYVNFAESHDFFAAVDGTDNPTTLLLPAHLHRYPEDGIRTINGGTLEALNILFTGGCYPCALAAETDIIVTVTDFLDNSIAIEVHID